MADTLENLIRLQKWRVDESRREIGRVLTRRETLAAELDALEQAFAGEKALAGGEDPRLSLTYHAYLERYEEQRDRYHNAIAQTDRMIEELQESIAEDFRTQKSYEQVRDARAERARQEAERREQAFIDDVAADRHLRRQREGRDEEGGETL